MSELQFVSVIGIPITVLLVGVTEVLLESPAPPVPGM